MNSAGGVYQEGMALGRLFYKAKVSTFVVGNGGTCLSACAMAFLGGRDSVTGEPLRAIIQGGSLGFHQFRLVFPPDRKFTKADLERSVGEVQKMVFDDLKYLKEIKQDPRTYRRVITEPTESMLLHPRLGRARERLPRRQRRVAHADGPGRDPRPHEIEIGGGRCDRRGMGERSRAAGRSHDEDRERRAVASRSGRRSAAGAALGAVAAVLLAAGGTGRVRAP